MTFIAFNKNFIDYNLLHKRMGYPIILTLKQIIKCLDLTFYIDKNIQLKFCDAFQFVKCHMQHLFL